MYDKFKILKLLSKRKSQTLPTYRIPTVPTYGAVPTKKTLLIFFVNFIFFSVCGISTTAADKSEVPTVWCLFS